MASMAKRTFRLSGSMAAIFVSKSAAPTAELGTSISAWILSSSLMQTPLGVSHLGVDVLLVYPDYTVVESLVRRGKYHVEEGGWYSEGLAALAARLKEAGHRPWLLHLTRPAEEEEFVSAIRSRDPAVVGTADRRVRLKWCPDVVPRASCGVLWHGVVGSPRRPPGFGEVPGSKYGRVHRA